MEASAIAEASIFYVVEFCAWPITVLFLYSLCNEMEYRLLRL
jgi:hypothetical protein